MGKERITTLQALWALDPLPPRGESSLPSGQGKPSTLFPTPIYVDTSIDPGVLLLYATFSKSLKQQPRELTKVGVFSISCPQRLYF